MARAPILLQRGILAGLIGAKVSQGDPTLLWTVDDSGWIYECRLTIPGAATYHGYPVLPNEAISRAVIVRYLSYVYAAAPNLIVSAQQVQARYS